MSWAKLDDGMWSHPKFLEISNGATGVWAKALSWSAQQLRNGAIPRTLQALLRATDSEIAELVGAGLWDQTEAGWQIHDYLVFNPSRESVLADRGKGKERARASYNKRKETSHSSPEETKIFGVSSGVPSRPVPSSDLLLKAVADTETSVRTEAVPSPASPAGRASRKIHEATLVEYHPASNKWRPALIALGGKSESEWKLASKVLGEEALKPDLAKRVLSPDHILAHWHLYSAGEAPGRKPLPIIKPEQLPVHRRELLASGGE